MDVVPEFRSGELGKGRAGKGREGKRRAGEERGERVRVRISLRCEKPNFCKKRTQRLKPNERQPSGTVAAVAQLI